VKLKRNVEYRGHVIPQSIRPLKIMESLHLKNVHKNPHYQDNWPEDSIEDDPQLWEALISKCTSNNCTTLHVLPIASNETDQPSDQRQESDYEGNDNEIEDRSEVNGLPFDSCLQPRDISADKDF
jgi:hypothetical protein